MVAWCWASYGTSVDKFHVTCFTFSIHSKTFSSPTHCLLIYIVFMWTSPEVYGWPMTKALLGRFDQYSWWAKYSNRPWIGKRRRQPLIPRCSPHFLRRLRHAWRMLDLSAIKFSSGLLQRWLFLQLHLATCDNLFPHVSLMNYTYLPSTPFDPTPVIIMTTNPSSKKTLNLINNPRVSLLVHDWVSHRPPTRAPDPTREGSPPPQATRSSLASLLLNINTSALSSISATINGQARIVEQGSEEERWCKEKHLENNTFGDQAREEQGFFGTTPLTETSEGDGGASCYIEGEDVRVVLVGVKEGRIADWKGGVKDWSIVSPETEGQRGRYAMTNGVQGSGKWWGFYR